MKTGKTFLNHRKAMLIITFAIVSAMQVFACGNAGKTQQPAMSLPTDTLEEVPVMPEFPGGDCELIKYLRNKVSEYHFPPGNYPTLKIIIRFVVGKDGSILCPQIIRGEDEDLDRYAMHIIRSMPKWKPGELEDGTKVNVRFTIPLIYTPF